MGDGLRQGRAPHRQLASCAPERNGGLGEAAFYAYAYPEPAGFGAAPVALPGAYSKDVGQFILPYEAVRTADAPDDVLMQFLQSSYEACADNAKWDRRALERQPPTR